jgi:hypothetical protein
MVLPTHELTQALRQTALTLRSTAEYQWGHFGACNCGHLAQIITRRSRAEIHRAALEKASSWALSPVADWGDAAVEYCPASGLPIDAILGEMLDAGLTLQDIRHLEDLSDRRVLARLPLASRHLRRNDKKDVARYLDTWADLMDETSDPGPFEEEAALAAE